MTGILTALAKHGSGPISKDSPQDIAGNIGLSKNETRLITVIFFKGRSQTKHANSSRCLIGILEAVKCVPSTACRECIAYPGTWSSVHNGSLMSVNIVTDDLQNMFWRGIT